MRKTIMLQIRITEDQRLAWSSRGERLGLTLSEWVREICDEAAAGRGVVEKVAEVAVSPKGPLPVKQEARYDFNRPAPGALLKGKV